MNGLTDRDLKLGYAASIFGCGGSDNLRPLQNWRFRNEYSRLFQDVVMLSGNRPPPPILSEARFGLYP